MPAISDKSKGIMYVITAAFGFSGMSLFVKLAGDLSAFQKAFFRNFIALIFMTVLIIKKQRRIYTEPRQYPSNSGQKRLRHNRAAL